MIGGVTGWRDEGFELFGGESFGMPQSTHGRCAIDRAPGARGPGPHALGGSGARALTRRSTTRPTRAQPQVQSKPTIRHERTPACHPACEPGRRPGHPGTRHRFHLHPTQAQSPATARTLQECAEWNISQEPYSDLRQHLLCRRARPEPPSSSPRRGHILIDGDLAGVGAEDCRQHAVSRVPDRGRETHSQLPRALRSRRRDRGIAATERRRRSRRARSPRARWKSGHSGQDDPQYGILPPIQKVSGVQVSKDGETVHVGPWP